MRAFNFKGMPSLHKALVLSTLVAAMGALLTACNKKEQGGSQGGGSTGQASGAQAAVDTGGEPEDPDANPDAKVGGSLNKWGGPAPKTLNPWLDWNWFTKELLGIVFESLVDLHPSENRPVGVLAESWETSADGLTFTFRMNPKARWSDGEPIQCDDIQFYYDVIMNPKNLTSLFRVGMDRFGRPECPEPLTVKMTAKQDHWMNFWEAGGWVALPKHAWEGKDFNQLNWELPVVSGPYRLDEVKKDRSVSMKRRADWWGFSKRYNKNKYNLETIRWRFMEDRLKALEAFKKGDIDVYPVDRAAIWAEKTDFDQVKKGWVAKTNVYNSDPKSFRGWVFNLRRPLFSDVRVREALCHLTNRQLMNEKFNHNLLFLLNTYYPDIYPGNKAPRPMRGYDPAKARELLAQAGWKAGADGILAKDGKRFEFTFTIPTGGDLRPINVFQEDLKSAGIIMKVEEMSWSTYAKRMDKYEFDMGAAGWGGVRLRDPEHMWHSKTASQPSSNNLPGVADKVIDSLSKAHEEVKDLDGRNAVIAKLDDRLNEIIPYNLLWEQDSEWLLYWNKFGTARWVYSKYLDEECIPTYWYADPAKESALKDAMAKGAALPAAPTEVRYGK